MKITTGDDLFNYYNEDVNFEDYGRFNVSHYADAEEDIEDIYDPEVYSRWDDYSDRYNHGGF